MGILETVSDFVTGSLMFRCVLCLEGKWINHYWHHNICKECFKQWQRGKKVRACK